jgi:hypothetical protein
MMDALRGDGYDEETLKEELETHAKIFPVGTPREELEAGLKKFVGKRIKH